MVDLCGACSRIELLVLSVCLNGRRQCLDLVNVSLSWCGWFVAVTGDGSCELDTRFSQRVLCENHVTNELVQARIGEESSRHKCATSLPHVSMAHHPAVDHRAGVWFQKPKWQHLPRIEPSWRSSRMLQIPEILSRSSDLCIDCLGQSTQTCVLPMASSSAEEHRIAWSGANVFPRLPWRQKADT